MIVIFVYKASSFELCPFEIEYLTIQPNMHPTKVSYGNHVEQFTYYTSSKSLIYLIFINFYKNCSLAFVSFLSLDSNFYIHYFHFKNENNVKVAQMYTFKDFVSLSWVVVF